MLLEYFKISGFQAGGVQLEWKTLESCSKFELRSSDSNSGPWQLIETLSKDSRNAVVDSSEVPSGHAFLSLKAFSISGLTEESYVYIDVTGLMRLSSGAIAMDPNGYPKALRTDMYGNLLVTGIDIGSAGTGDASSSLQVQQLTSIDALRTDTQSVLSQLSSILSKLSDVRLNSSQISSLKDVTVSNIPSDFPDAAAEAAINSVIGIMPTSAQVSTLNSNILEILKLSDVSFAPSGAIHVNVENFPTQFNNTSIEDSNLLLVSKSDIIIAGLQSILGGVNASNAGLDDLLTESANTYNLTSLILDAVLNELNVSLESIDAKISSLDSVTAKDTSINQLITEVSGLMKTGEIPVTLAGDVRTELMNLPADFPDTASASLLSDILSEVSSIDTNNVRVSDPLPSGSNIIGKVEVVSSVRPPNAAKDTTLVGVYNAIVSLANNLNTSAPGSIKSLLLGLSEQSGNILTKMDEMRDPIVLFQTDENELHPIVQSSIFTTGKIVNSTCGEVLVSVVVDTVCTVKMSITSSNGNLYYPVSGFSRLDIMPGQVNIFRVPSTLKNIKIDLINTSSTEAVSNVILSVLSIPR